MRDFTFILRARPRPWVCATLQCHAAKPMRNLGVQRVTIRSSLVLSNRGASEHTAPGGARSHGSQSRHSSGIEGQAMLVLSRKVGEVIVIGDTIRLTVVEVRANRVRLGIECPKEVNVF